MNKTIRLLDLRYNSLGGNVDNIHFFLEALMWNKTITEIYLDEIKIKNPEEWKKLFEALMKNYTITSLHLRWNKFGSNLENIQILSDFFKANKTITELSLSDNEIKNPEEWKVFYEALVVNQTITTLDLKCNSLGGHVDNMHFFSEAVRENKTITKLDLFDNEINNSEEFEILGKALKVNKSITCLDLKWNSRGNNKEIFHKILSEVLMENKTITTLNYDLEKDIFWEN